MRRPAARPITVTKRTSGDTAQILVRAGDKDLGTITQMGSDSDDTLSGNFANRPAFADLADAFHALTGAVQSGDIPAVSSARARLEGLSVQVWHSVHEMRIDEPGSLVITAGRARFRPNAAFLMMRTGGL